MLRDILVLLCLGLLTGCQTVTSDTLDQDIADAGINAAVKTRLVMDPQAAQVTVETVRSQVYLTGSVPTQDEKQRAHQVAMEVPGVLTVVNNLQVEERPKL